MPLSFCVFLNLKKQRAIFRKEACPLLRFALLLLLANLLQAFYSVVDLLVVGRVVARVYLGQALSSVIPAVVGLLKGPWQRDKA